MQSDIPRPSAVIRAAQAQRTPLPGGPWTGTSVIIRHGADGTVTASSLGLSATARTEWEALRELARLVKAAGLVPVLADTDSTAPKPAG
jgi:hypothetical protein